VELLDQLIPGTDADIIAPLHKMITKQYENIFLRTKVTAVDASDSGLTVHFDGPKAPETDTFDQILVAVGRQPNGAVIGADRAGVIVDSRGFISVDKQQRTNVPHIFAIGDIVGSRCWRTATHEGHVAPRSLVVRRATSTRGSSVGRPHRSEVAWVGVTENKRKPRASRRSSVASGRSLSLGRSEGLTKLIFDQATERVIGCGIVGPSAGDLIAEVALAIEMGADAADIALTVHPHPTLSETVGFSAEAFEGTITDLYMPKKKK
jgi:dihydrolipoamide dehydrogenase